ncbi:MAG TPA: hypothetical protein VFB62_06330 [Polyangiaceae bacterium]|jgi:hypothetical protein|nr:hypothetical protein [Polyangiaceae bacterium]
MGEKPQSPHLRAHADPAVMQQQMAALVKKLERANATLQRVAEARSDILGLVPEVSDATGAPVDSARLDHVHDDLAEVRRRLYDRGYRFSPEVIELRRLEAELLRERERLSPPR